MKPFRYLLVLSFVGLAAAVARAAEPAPAPGDSYQLAWSDEFNQNGPLNPADWSYEHGFVRNRELQWYQPQNASCSNGLLVIEARREKVTNPSFDPQSHDWRKSREFAQYTSASVTTRGKHAWRYGRFVMRARIDTRAGSWPAFWTLGTTRPWPECGEVDIMEFYKKTLLANIGWAEKPWTIRWNSVKTPLSKFPPDWSSQFHLWQMDWTADRIALSVDGKVLCTQDLATTLNEKKPDDNPFHRPAYILLNLAIGGQGGDPSHTEFPMRYEIDYVRIYQKPSDAK